MGLIFTGSSQTKTQVSNFYWVNFVVFKSLHIIEYALLFFLWFRAIYYSFPQIKNINFCFFIAFLLTIIYSGTDEFHQLFVISRSGSYKDILIDTLGIIILLLFIKKNFRLVKKIL